MSAVELFVWGLLLHFIADWLFQNEWMAVNKAKRRKKEEVWFEPDLEVIAIQRPSRWWDRHPAAYVHAGIHGLVQLLIFPWWAALLIGFIHLLIDTRTPLTWWAKLIRQTLPSGHVVDAGYADDASGLIKADVPLFDIGADVAIWRDQVAHMIVLAVAALVVTGV